MSVSTCFCNPIGDLAVDPTSGTLIATHPRDCTISILDAEDPAAAVAIRVDGDPVAVAAAGGRAVVATTSASYDAVSVLDIDSKTVLSVHPLAFTVTGIAVSPDGARAFAARTGRLGSDVAAVGLATAEITSIPVTASGRSSIDVIRTGADGYLYASMCSHRDGELVVVDSARRRTVATIPVGAPVRDIMLSPDGAWAYVLAHHPHGAAAAICINLARKAISAVVEVSESAIQIAMSPDGSEIYVVERDGIAVICTMSDLVFDRITLDVPPSCVATSSMMSRLYVADHMGDITALPIATPMLQAAAS